jgi:hypothetical protein
MLPRDMPGGDARDTDEATDDRMRRAAANLASSLLFTAQRSGKPWQVWDDLVAVDHGVRLPAPPNSAVLLRPPTPESAPELIERVGAFYAGHQGGGWQIWSAWPTPDLSGAGYDWFEVPCLVRDVGPRLAALVPVPDGLSIREVDDGADLRASEALLIEAFAVPDTEPGFIYLEDVLGDPAFRIWLGEAEGRPVSTSAAFISDGFVGVYNVATALGARGRGFGEALTWAATLCQPELPAMLQASAMGEPIYERMGYGRIGAFEVWSHPPSARA